MKIHPLTPGFYDHDLEIWVLRPVWLWPVHCPSLGFILLLLEHNKASQTFFFLKTF